MLTSDTYTRLQPIYPLLIQQFVDDYQLSDGIAIDIGVGPGWLGLEMSKITNMKIVFMDISQESLDLAKKNFEALKVDNAAEFLKADVEEIPIEDNYADFIMSRGSLWFWENPEKGLWEIYRILKPGGVAIIGGGLGKYIPQSMRARLYEHLRQTHHLGNGKKPSIDQFKAAVEKAAMKAELPNYKIVADGEADTGRWIEIRKQ